MSLSCPVIDVDDEAEPDLARELEPGLGLALHIDERITWQGGFVIRQLQL